MKKAMIYGAGVSGKSVENLLGIEEYETVLVDDKKGISSINAVSYLEGIDLFVKSPGIPYNNLVQEVIKRNIKIVDEVEVAYNYMKKTSNTKIIAITGTNGKTTTTSKVAELLNLSGKKAVPAGNIGTPYSTVVLEKEKYEYIVLELSSYQLENLYEFKADIALVINLAPDHLDRYSGKDDYYDAKFNIAMNQGKEDFFIVNIDDEEILKRTNKISSKLVKISLEKEADVYAKENKLFNKKGLITKTDDFTLKGQHNLQNILFITAIGELLEIPNQKIVKLLETTENLEHRMEDFYVDHDKNLKFINDSKGTNIESTLKAIGSFQNPILICGGCDKKLDLTPLVNEIVKKVKKVYLIGELANKLEKELVESGYSKSKILNLKDLEKVVESIKAEGAEDSTILLSPATSSFDQFKSFQERGKEFKRLVLEKFKNK